MQIFPLKLNLNSLGKIEATIINGIHFMIDLEIRFAIFFTYHKSYILIGLHSSYATVPSVIEFIMSSSNAQVVNKE